LELEAEILESTKESKDLFRSKQLVNDLNSLYRMWESLCIKNLEFNGANLVTKTHVFPSIYHC